MADLTKAPKSANWLMKRLKSLREKKREKKQGRSRRRLTPNQRESVLKKTGSLCHICGGKINPKDEWQADHVAPHSTGGRHDLANYLPTHKLCNNYRWDYSEVEIQYILKIGVWARKQMEVQTPLGKRMAETFVKNEQKRAKR